MKSKSILYVTALMLSSTFAQAEAIPEVSPWAVKTNEGHMYAKQEECGLAKLRMTDHNIAVLKGIESRYIGSTVPYGEVKIVVDECIAVEKDKGIRKGITSEEAIAEEMTRYASSKGNITYDMFMKDLPTMSRLQEAMKEVYGDDQEAALRVYYEYMRADWARGSK